MPITVCLHRTETEGNVGAIARVMKNFSFSDLILVNPLCDYLSEESRRRSKHAIDVLKKIKVKKDFSFIKNYDLVIGTTSIVGTDYNINRSPVELREFIQKFVSSYDSEKKFISEFKKLKILILFGNEGTGLTTEELVLCDHLVTINSSNVYSALNLSHAVGIVLYEFFNMIIDKKIKNNDKGKVEIASRDEKKRLIKLIDDLVENVCLSESKKNPTRDSMRKMISKSILTKREIFSLMGFFKKLKK